MTATKDERDIKIEKMESELNYLRQIKRKNEMVISKLIAEKKETNARD